MYIYICVCVYLDADLYVALHLDLYLGLDLFYLSVCLSTYLCIILCIYTYIHSYIFYPFQTRLRPSTNKFPTSTADGPKPA